MLRPLTLLLLSVLTTCIGYSQITKIESSEITRETTPSKSSGLQIANITEPLLGVLRRTGSRNVSDTVFSIENTYTIIDASAPSVVGRILIDTITHPGISPSGVSSNGRSCTPTPLAGIDVDGSTDTLAALISGTTTMHGTTSSTEGISFIEDCNFVFRNEGYIIQKRGTTQFIGLSKLADIQPLLSSLIGAKGVLPTADQLLTDFK